MQFSQAQIRETLGMSVETLRHWKRVLPPFAERKKYTLGDLLAAGILHRLTEQCGVRAGCLSTISKSVVEICNANAWAALNDKTLVIDVQNGTCSLVRDVGSFSFEDAIVVCPLRRMMIQIQDALSRMQPVVAQHHLQFPPIPVRQARPRRRA